LSYTRKYPLLKLVCKGTIFLLQHKCVSDFFLKRILCCF